MKHYTQQEGAIAARAAITVAAIILVVAGIVYLTNTPQEDAMIQENDAMMQENDSMMEENNAMMEYGGEVLAGSSAPLLDFSRADYEKAIASDKLVVLYFYAKWCPVCAEEVANSLYPAFHELSSDSVIGFRVNYNDNDTDSYEKSLASEFGVAYQHTKVFIKNGERILKSPESWDKDRYLSEIQNAL